MVAIKLGKAKRNKILIRAKKDQRAITRIFRERFDQQENYFHCPCPISVEADNTGKPLTSHVTKKFNHSVQSRSDYDQYWLQVYNGHSEKTNYNLP